MAVKNPHLKKQKDPKPCPTCYAPMASAGKDPDGDPEFRCFRHGLLSEINAARPPWGPPKKPKVVKKVVAPKPVKKPKPKVKVKRVRQKRPWKPRTYTPEELAAREARQQAYRQKVEEVVSRYKAGEWISVIAKDYTRLGYANENSAVVSIYRILDVAGARQRGR